MSIHISDTSVVHTILCHQKIVGCIVDSHIIEVDISFATGLGAHETGVTGLGADETVVTDPCN